MVAVLSEFQTKRIKLFKTCSLNWGSINIHACPESLLKELK
jgi:hypothetical protein